jgi:hypothetical protein
MSPPVDPGVLIPLACRASSPPISLPSIAHAGAVSRLDSMYALSVFGFSIGVLVVLAIFQSAAESGSCPGVQAWMGIMVSAVTRARGTPSCTSIGRSQRCRRSTER